MGDYWRWDDDAGLNVVIITRGRGGGALLQVAHGPVGGRSSVAVRLSPEVVDGLRAALDGEDPGA